MGKQIITKVQYNQIRKLIEVRLYIRRFQEESKKWSYNKRIIAKRRIKCKCGAYSIPITKDMMEELRGK